MKTPWMIAGICGLALLMAACGSNNKAAKESTKAVMEAAVTVNDISTPVKTAKGTPVRVYEVTPASEASTVTKPLPGMEGTVAQTNKSLIAVVGDSSVTVDIPNARIIMIGGKSVTTDLVMVGPTVLLVSATNPAGGCTAVALPVEDVLKQVKAGKLNLPEADKLP